MRSDGVRMVSGRVGPAPLWSTCTGDVMAIHGEVDVSTCELFASMVEEALDRAEGGGAQHEIHVDLGGLDFIDVSGARVLVVAGAGLSLGSQLVIDRPPALLARILEVGWCPVTGLRLGPREPTGGPGSAAVGDRSCETETLSLRPYVLAAVPTPLVAATVWP